MQRRNIFQALVLRFELQGKGYDQIAADLDLVPDATSLETLFTSAIRSLNNVEAFQAVLERAGQR